MTYVFDLDGTLCHTDRQDYAHATPRPDRIAEVQRLYDAGHRIIIESARGSMTGTDWRPLTLEQLRAWGVPFHEVRVGVKFYGDIYVDDKGVAADAFFDEA